MASLMLAEFHYETQEYDMNVEYERAQVRAARRKEIENMLRNYPEVEPATLAELLSWFRQDASSMDVAMLSTVDELKDAYRAFRKDHLDRNEKTEVILTVIGISSIAAILLVAAYII